ncbi:gamma-aminobutyric acid receptor-associated protein-like 2 isoform X1 [Sander lucioperca]|uniref:gamma-aminobutyric acid receptor-associated protein-like 2 isoform X1 n=1 Tax=Sander lucioperca TaxID=283035 RepID=UPI00125D9EE9|nr:gamma-aminobutyric acid receptor-associated protein-like 2 isoform X1 [Sander lucioperca]
MKWMFKEDHSLEHRCVESAKIRNKYPDRVPVIVEKVSGSQIVDIDKRKYLVPSDITVAQFMWIIRKRIQLPSEKAIFLFVDKTVPQSSRSSRACMLVHECLVVSVSDAEGRDKASVRAVWRQSLTTFFQYFKYSTYTLLRSDRLLSIHRTRHQSILLQNRVLPIQIWIQACHETCFFAMAVDMSLSSVLYV